METESQYTRREEFVVREAADSLLLRVDLSYEFHREGFIEELKKLRETPCPIWIKEFHTLYDPYSISEIETGYRTACSELIEYFSDSPTWPRG